MKKPNILYIGICCYNRLEGIEKAFIDASHYYHGVRPENVNEGLKSLQWRPDIVFLQVQSENYPSSLKSILRHYKNKGSKVIQFNGDIRHETPKFTYDLAEACTVTCFSNDRDVENVRKAGYRAEFLQIGIDPEVFTPEGPKDPNAGKIVFLANHAPHFPNGKLRMQLVRELKKTYGNDFKVYGNGWGDLASGECNVKNPLQEVNQWQKKEAAIYRGCNVAISMSSFTESRYTSDRLFRAMGCGAMTMIHNFPRIEKVICESAWPHNVFNNFDELKKYIGFYLNDKQESWDLVAKRTHNNYTYKHMVNRIISL